MPRPGSVSSGRWPDRDRRQRFGEQVGVFVVATFLNEEVGDRRRNLQAGRHRAWPLQRACGTGLRVVLEHLAPPGDAGIGRDLHEHPGVLEYERLDLRDLDRVLGGDLRRVGLLRAPGGVEAERRGAAEQSTKPGAAVEGEVDIGTAYSFTSLT